MSNESSMIIILNGPLGIGKSTLAEALSERIAHSVMLDGDQLAAANPLPPDEMEHLHSTIALLVSHHRHFGYRHFVIDHFWRSSEELEDLRKRIRDVDATVDTRVFLLTLPLEENLRRIRLRQSARALDEHEFGLRTVAEERKVLFENGGRGLGESFDVSAPPAELVTRMLRQLQLS